MTAVRANALTGRDWLKNSFSIWRGIGRDCHVAEHPASFPVALVTKLIDCFAADRQGTVLDPFAGSGSTMVAALRSGLSAVGFDINPEYRRLFESRLSLFESHVDGSWKYHVQDARTLDTVVPPCSIELCVTSPPYWDILNRRRTADCKVARPYSRNESDLGNVHEYGDFVEALRCVCVSVGHSLRPGGYFVMDIMDIRKGARFYPLHQDATTAVLSTELFTLEDIIIWDRQADYNSMRPLGYPYKFIINKVHEYLLVFRKEGSMAKQMVDDNDLYEIATYLSNPAARVEIHAELPHGHRDGFEEEYAAATDNYPLPAGTGEPYYVWPEGTNKYGRELRIYFNRVPPEPPPIKTLYTDHGKWYARREQYRINHSNLVMQLLECGFVLGNRQDADRIERFMQERFPVRST